MKPSLRRSEVEALLACPSAETDGTSEAAAFGSLVHVAIERLYAGDSPADAMHHALAFAGGVHPDRFDEAAALVWRFAATHDTSRPVLYVEQELAVEEEIARLTGTPDVVEFYQPDAGGDGLCVTDVKTTWQRPDPEVPPFQLRFYAGLLLRTHEQVSEITARLDHIRLNDGVAEWVWSREEVLAWWADMLRLLAVRLPQRGQVRTGGGGCAYCRHRWSCADTIAEAAQSVRDDEHAAQLVQELVRLEAAADDRKAALKAHMKGRDPVVWHGLEVGYRAGGSSVRLTDKAKALELGVATEAEGSARFGLRNP